MEELGSQVISGSVWLEPFDVEAPTLTTGVGVTYVPIRWLCDLLGLAPSHWIGTVCAYYRDWDSHDTPEAVRRLPYERPDGTTRAEWSLEWGSVLRWLSFHLDSRYVPAGERHDQLIAFRERVFHATSALYSHQQAKFHTAKRGIIQWLQDTEQALKSIERMERVLSPHIEHSAPTPKQGQSNRTAFAEFVENGRQRYMALADALRATLPQMLDAPIVDAIRVDEAGAVIDTVAMPLVPYTPDLSEINHRHEEAETWLTHDFVIWLRAHGFDASYERSEPSSDGEEPGS